MNTYPEHASFPPERSLKGASFYSSTGLISNINMGATDGHEYVVFEYDSNSGETAHTDTIAAIKAELPKTPTTSLSRTSGFKLERVGEWIFAFEPGRRVDDDGIDGLIDDVLQLLEYAKAFPQNF